MKGINKKKCIKILGMVLLAVVGIWLVLFLASGKADWKLVFLKDEGIILRLPKEWDVFYKSKSDAYDIEYQYSDYGVDSKTADQMLMGEPLVALHKYGDSYEELTYGCREAEKYEANYKNLSDEELNTEAQRMDGRVGGNTYCRVLDIYDAKHEKFIMLEYLNEAYGETRFSYKYTTVANKKMVSFHVYSPGDFSQIEEAHKSILDEVRIWNSTYLGLNTFFAVLFLVVSVMIVSEVRTFQKKKQMKNRNEVDN